jgi:hypothetical protein
MTAEPDRAADLLDTGPAPRRWGRGGPLRRRWFPRATAAGRRRWTLVTAAVLGAAVVVLTLRTTVGEDRPPSVADVAPPKPPYDGQAGRTPIPRPDRVGDRLSGSLPAVGPPSKAAAGRAAELVLGRFCAEPARYSYTLQPDAGLTGAGWEDVRVLIFSLDSSGSGPVQQLVLRWTGPRYRWTGSPTLLAGC